MKVRIPEEWFLLQAKLKRLELERKEAEVAQKERQAEHLRDKLVIAEAEKACAADCPLALTTRPLSQRRVHYPIGMMFAIIGACSVACWQTRLLDTQNKAANHKHPCLHACVLSSEVC